jgi:hypothetical protein
MTTSKTGNPVAASTHGRPAPVRVKLQRINASLARAHPPDGNGKVWWARLKKALGTSSSAFVDASLFQLQGAARLHNGSISEIAVNWDRKGAKPRTAVWWCSNMNRHEKWPAKVAEAADDEVAIDPPPRGMK